MASVTDLKSLLESKDPGTLRRHASLALTERNYEKSLKLYTAAIALEPANGANYLRRYKTYRRVSSMIESMAGNVAALQLPTSLSQLSPGDFAVRMIRDLDSAISLQGWDKKSGYNGDTKKDKSAVEALESRASLLTSQANCTFASMDYNLLLALPKASVGGDGKIKEYR